MTKKTKEQLAEIARDARIDADEARATVDRVEAYLVNVQNAWSHLDNVAIAAQRAVDTWKEPVVPVKPVVPFV